MIVNENIHYLDKIGNIKYSFHQQMDHFHLQNKGGGGGSSGMCLNRDRWIYTYMCLLFGGVGEFEVYGECLSVVQEEFVRHVSP